MHAFIVRPFGTQAGIDFDRVQEELLEPALAELGIDGDTTGPIAYAGNIRADMFELLAKSDLVLADISIHNANVFYELGARHALRDRRTFLLRCRGHDVPFDLRTDRYLEYDAQAPAQALEALVEGLRQTLERPAVDSPIFSLVPNLVPQDWTRLVAVPEDFREEVERAGHDRRPGDLELLSIETRDAEWAPEGLRLVGRWQFNLKAWEGARETWEAVRDILDGDLEADLILATVYQRLGDPGRSDAAVKRAIARPELGDHERAEACALTGRNAKDRWRRNWQKVPSGEQPGAALASKYLNEALRWYEAGFAADLNHFFSGINALALMRLSTDLAAAHSEVWESNFDSDVDAARRLVDLEAERKRLEAAVTLSVRRRRQRLDALGRSDRWAAITEADLALLTDASPQRVARRYSQALEGAEDFYFDAVRGQLDLYRQLGVLGEHVSTVIETIDVRQEQRAESDDESPTEIARVLLFTGHRIDAPDRERPRFPPTASAESAARQAIDDAVQRELEAAAGGTVIGIAGGASGGDLLFHEVCGQRNIATELYLAIPPDAFIAASVEVAGHPEWVERFRAVQGRCPTRVLCPDARLPRWLAQRKHYDVWQRNSLWCLHNALAHGGAHLTLLALWDGARGDGPGGTEDMVRKARARGAKFVHLDTRTLFDLDDS